MKPATLMLAIAVLWTSIATAQPAPKVAMPRHVASGIFTLVVKADGTVVGWGRDTDGQSARPASPRGNIGTPIVVDLPGKALQVALGELTSYALLEDGTVVAWGPNDSGQLGNGPMGASGELGRYPKPSITPVRVTGLNDIIQIAAGSRHAVALRQDGTVWAWGARDEGAIGDGQPNTLRPVMAIGPTQVGYGQIGVGTSGGYYSKPVPVKGMANVSSIHLGGMRSLAVRADGSLWLWGFASSGGQGMLGKNLHVPTLLPLP